MRILFVCLGNICRSPMAEGIMRHKIGERKLELHVDSCGTLDAHEGENPDPRAQEEMVKRGIEIGNIVARPFEEKDFERFDRIYAMDEKNHEDIRERARNEEEQAKVMMTLDQLPDMEAGTPVPDPYFGAEEGFKTVYQLLDRATDTILKQVEDEEPQR
ncbi:MAG: low molecular weight protein-tyrosine-phosphatase [Flavobacteriales bacterium]